MENSTKHGTVRVCPNCGATVAARSLKCEDCGYAFQGVEVPDIVKRFEEQVNSANVLTRTGIIKRFPVPNTEEALLAMIEYLQPLCDEHGGVNFNPYEAKAFQSKFKECLTRAKIAFPNHPTVLVYKELDKKRKRKSAIIVTCAIVGLCAIFAACFIALSYMD